MSIRARLLALMLVLLAIPWVGYRYVQEMEGFLRRGQEDALLGGARALAGALHGRDALFPSAQSAAPDLYAHALATPPQLDGYATDWGAVPERGRTLPWASVTTSRPEPRLALGLAGDHLFVLLDVADATPTRATAVDRLSGDHVVLRVIDRSGQRHHYLIDTADSGPIQALSLVRDSLGQPGTRRELRVRGVQRRNDSGYTLELRLPVAMLGERLAVSVTDADEPGIEPVRAGSSRPDAELGILILPSRDISAIVAALGATPGRRIWVVDRESRVLARGGSLTRATALDEVPKVFSWILRLPAVVRFADPGPVSRLDNAEVRTALTGQTATRWRASENESLFVVSAAHPVWSGDNVVGAVLVEESSLPIQTARSQALVELFTTTLVVFVVAAVGLALFASSISRRVRRLHGEARTAIDAHGRVVGDIGTRYGNDEIGELADGMSGLLQRLAEYNRYLERLASRLSHELRTPLAVIRSSLDNVELSSGDEDKAFIDRARGGVTRLQSLITRLGEATRIEQAVRSRDIERLDLGEWLAAATDAYQDTWAERHFEVSLPTTATPVNGSGELLLQMLDKLVTNALDFAPSDTVISIRLLRDGDICRLQVDNEGPELPADMEDRLFESMVSVRSGGNDDGQAHLGLGLYIVRLIAEGHGGRVSATQLRDPDRVRFEVSLPLAA